MSMLRCSSLCSAVPAILIKGLVGGGTSKAKPEELTSSRSGRLQRTHTKFHLGKLSYADEDLVAHRARRQSGPVTQA